MLGFVRWSYIVQVIIVSMVLYLDDTLHLTYYICINNDYTGPNEKQLCADWATLYKYIKINK